MSTIREEFNDLKGKVATMLAQVEKMYCALTGDCDCKLEPKKGVVSRLESCEAFILFWNRFWWAVLISFLTIPPSLAVAAICFAFKLSPK